jgi:putative glutathione S-transferase
MTRKKPILPDEHTDTGSFERQEDAFVDWVRADDSSSYPAAKGRYHLYVSYACPWASRMIILRKIKGLEELISMDVVDPIREDEEGWVFRDGPNHGPDTVNGFRFLRQAYRATDPRYAGRVTVPVLWDKQTNRIVSNNDDHLMRIFNSEFNEFTSDTSDLYPPALRPQIDELNERIYHNVNNGVYRAGFASTQAAYEAAVYPLFDTLDMLESRLQGQAYLFGDQIVETDWRLFVTLIRFDAVYYVHFKCNLRRILDYPNLHGYIKRLYEVDGVADTVDFDHIKRHYYYTHDDINPFRIVPVGPKRIL